MSNWEDEESCYGKIGFRVDFIEEASFSQVTGEGHFHQWEQHCAKGLGTEEGASGDSTKGERCVAGACDPWGRREEISLLK